MVLNSLWNIFNSTVWESNPGPHGWLVATLSIQPRLTKRIPIFESISTHQKTLSIFQDTLGSPWALGLMNMFLINSFYTRLSYIIGKGRASEIIFSSGQSHFTSDISNMNCNSLRNIFNSTVWESNLGLPEQHPATLLIQPRLTKRIPISECISTHQKTLSMFQDTLGSPWALGDGDPYGNK